MKKEIKDFLIKVVKEGPIDLHQEAKELLEEEFKETTLSVFGYKLCYYRNFKKRVLQNDKIGFICEIQYDSECVSFVNANFDKLDLIIEILRKHIESEEKEKLESEEVKENE